MIEIVYACQTCGKVSPEESSSMICECGGRLWGEGGAGVVGTRDNFGIKNEFKDDDTGQTIDNWKSWEKAGYRNPLDTTKNHAVREKIKEKIKKVKNA